MVRNQSQN